METQKWLRRTKLVGSNVFNNLIYNIFMKILKKLNTLSLLVKELFLYFSKTGDSPLSVTTGDSNWNHIKRSSNVRFPNKCIGIGGPDPWHSLFWNPSFLGRCLRLRRTHGKSCVQQEEDSLYQQIGLKFEEETSKMLHLEHGFVWCWNLDASGSR